MTDEYQRYQALQESMAAKAHQLLERGLRTDKDGRYHPPEPPTAEQARARVHFHEAKGAEAVADLEAARRAEPVEPATEPSTGDADGGARLQPVPSTGDLADRALEAGDVDLSMRLKLGEYLAAQERKRNTDPDWPPTAA